ncbi:UBX domain protein [Aspergillus sclerotialis]|uniref:UBX domain-containing protein 2 n=1 Tax=Aspergillus sclerotialis TaxID=2070753 RepID=A0A3A2ZZ88_9EURO|nr:UBX domain protein [Aspergillus sclerotialis]
MFYQGSLQDGINLAVNQAKAVICFVRDETDVCLQWEKDYFGDDEFTESLKDKSVIFKLTAGSPEAGFLASFCPITKFPVVVVIKGGMLRQYLVPEITKDDFRKRLMASLEDSYPHGQISSTPKQEDSTEANATADPTQPTTDPASGPASPFASQCEPGTTRIQQGLEQRRDESIRTRKRHAENAEKSDSTRRGQIVTEVQQANTEHVRNINCASQEKDRQTQISGSTVPISGSPVSHSEEVAMQQNVDPTPPKQCRLQVRLFDGTSVRSNFSPSQSIRKDVRSWLDAQLTDDSYPYNLKHILTPLPNETISVADEDKSLEDLGLGPSANLVMVPIQSYTQAYTGSAFGLPIRAMSSVCRLLFSAAGTVAGLMGSVFGFGRSTPTDDGPVSLTARSPANSGARRLRPAASQATIIRTLRDRPEERDNNQLYNGNQLNFEPQKDSDDE